MAVAGARLWLEPSVGWVACWGCPGSAARTPSSFQSADSVLGLRASKSVCMFFKSRVLVSYSPLARLTALPTNQEGSTSWCQTPELGCPMWSLNPSLLREDARDFEIPLVFWVTQQRCESYSSPPTRLHKVLSLQPWL